MLLSLLLLSDVPHPLQIEMQGNLVESFFADMKLEVKIALTGRGRKPFRDICNWEYRQDTRVACENGLLISVGLYDIAICQLRFAFAPPTLRFMNLRRCGQTNGFHVRQLPRCLQRIDFSGNFMIGTLDLRNLPRRLERFIGRQNLLSGSLTLCNLPRTLVTLDLSVNKELGPQTLLFDNLPASLKEVSLQRTKVRDVMPIDSAMQIPVDVFKIDARKGGK